MMSLFIVAASLHVLHQCAYLTDCYRVKAGSARALLGEARRLRSPLFVDLPHRALQDRQRHLLPGRRRDRDPFVLDVHDTAYFEWVVFAGFLGAWLYKTMLEHREGSLNVPKSLLIGVTIFFAFIVPGMAGRSRLELAFQSMNAWHSFQYLGLVWLINTMRLERGALTNKFVAKLSGTKGAEVVLRVELRDHALASGLRERRRQLGSARSPAEQYYYMLILSPLLIHYYFDTFVFLDVGADLVPAPSRRRRRLRRSNRLS